MDLFFQDSLDRLPRIAAADSADRGFAQWTEAAARLPDAGLAAQAKALAEDPAGSRLLEAVFANSAFLTDCMLAEPAFLMDLLGRGPDATLDEVLRGLDEQAAAETDPQRLMPVLRLARRKVALLVALADLTGHWSLERIVEALSDFADRALSAAVGRLLVRAAERGELELA
ncbi:MAG TPA: glutamine-synthetase adenylyltransferase, partial [Kiloniellales bacterium]|nr:glutamine-synthetase adenylyltransferase [Kiloniellales bacterium]